MNAVPDTYPITGVCVVSDPTKTPPGYEVLLRSEDKRDDCDLWKDGLFRAKVKRYLCLTRQYQESNYNQVLVDIVINNERDPVPAEFQLLDITVDTREKATRKKQICYKMIPRSDTTDAISDIILLSRQRRPPSGYTLVGEMNGILVCYKLGPVPEESVQPPPQQETSEQQSSLTRAKAERELKITSSAPEPVNHNAMPNMNQSIRRQESITMANSALFGVPFQLNPRYQDVSALRQVTAPHIDFRSHVDIENEYNYPFRLESQAARGVSPPRE